MLVDVPSHRDSRFAVQHGIGGVCGIHIRVYLQVVQSRAVRALTNCFQEVEANVQFSQEKDTILTFEIRQYQFLASNMEGLASCNDGMLLACVHMYEPLSRINCNMAECFPEKLKWFLFEKLCQGSKV